MERMKEDLKKQNVAWASMERNDPTEIADATKSRSPSKASPAYHVERVPQ